MLKYDQNTFDALIRTALNRAPANPELAKIFLDSSAQAKRYVIGRNEQSAAVAALLRLDGLIDDFAINRVPWNGLPLIRLNELPQNAIVLNCSTSISPISVLGNLQRAGINRVLNYADLVEASNAALDWPDFVLKMRADYAEHVGDWFALFGLLEDEISRQVLLDTMCYRVSAQPDYMTGYSVRLRDQYFEGFMQYREEVFVDAGGFDGDTTEEFCTRYPDYHAVHLFEPSSANIAAARARLVGRERVHFVQRGLSDQTGVLHFNPDAGSASAVSDAGSESIEVDTLDAMLPGPVSFIKMDLEGWELQALTGARLHIVQDHPKLAIAVYHAAADFRVLPAYIRSLRQDYRMFLRHYTEGWSETVMYFLPSA
ncbi:FkbM family methyltransferase [Uliginosibacterium sp. TH139]|uniref:FkbM family methyltransferase n=1 Tax=Uliginosibacterium sp. TH139 TaxID=2067453 RepID=UPI000C7D963B|nr:FkbM family methyltransferase [Uliginosibacterium sp. TH139]PLK48669.1 FkbM family methyltransferase [Uliginosibacterium sp. TH139]